jgi:hypothetical protein
LDVFALAVVGRRLVLEFVVIVQPENGGCIEHTLTVVLALVHIDVNLECHDFSSLSGG